MRPVKNGYPGAEIVYLSSAFRSQVIPRIQFSSLGYCLVMTLLFWWNIGRANADSAERRFRGTVVPWYGMVVPPYHGQCVNSVLASPFDGVCVPWLQT